MPTHTGDRAFFANPNLTMCRQTKETPAPMALTLESVPVALAAVNLVVFVVLKTLDAGGRLADATVTSLVGFTLSPIVGVLLFGVGAVWLVRGLIASLPLTAPLATMGLSVAPGVWAVLHWELLVR